MSKSKEIIFFVAVLLFSFSLVYSQSKETGAIIGKVVDTDAKPLPGVSVLLSSPNLIGGPQTALTSQDGRYRFVALPPGRYSVEASLVGFVKAKSERIDVTVGVTLTSDFVLRAGAIETTIDVIGKAPLIDLHASTTAEISLDQTYLQLIPSRNVTTSIVMMAPGVTYTGSAFGGEEDSGVLSQTDGVNNTESTYGSGMAVRLDYNAIQEARIMGVGAPAEYDGIGGIVADMVTKSGGNKFQLSGGFIYEGKSWNSTNTSVASLKPPVEQYLDANANIGGPLVKDKLWYFGSFRYERNRQDVTGFSSPIDDKKYNALLKLTAQVLKNTRLQGFFDLEGWKTANWNATSLTSPEAAASFKLNNNVWNASLLHIFGSSTFLEAKVAGFSGRQTFQGNQGTDVPGHVDLATGNSTANFALQGDTPISRVQVSAALSHHADDFIGTHDFKFGVQYETASSKNYLAYSGGQEYLDVLGQPYVLAISEGSRSNTTNTTLSFFAQDSWNVGDRLTINPGLRLNVYRGFGNNAQRTDYKNSVIAPRIGVSYDLFGDKSTAIKAHYGWYYSAMLANFYQGIDNITSPLTYALWMGPGVGYVDVVTLNRQGSYSMDPDVKHPRQDEFTVAVERTLFKDLSLSVTYINRRGRNFIQDVNYTGQFVESSLVDPVTGQTISVWQQTNPGVNQYIYTNPQVGGAYSIVMIDPSRKYQGLEFVLNKRFSDNWMMIASYTYSRSRGTFSTEFGGSQPGIYGLYNDPNNQTNAFGRPNDDPTHMFKLQATATLPWGILFGTNFTTMSGSTYTETVQVLLAQGITSIRLEPMGSHRLRPYTNLDFRLEKQLKFGDAFMMGVFANAFNLLNRSVPVAVVNLAGANFGSPISLNTPRAIRAGIRLSFY
jgi:TonB dependent receptor-like, beta-barrel/Carboxypeptidase regulatory-like domain